MSPPIRAWLHCNGTVVLHHCHKLVSHYNATPPLCGPHRPSSWPLRNMLPCHVVVAWPTLSIVGPTQHTLPHYAAVAPAQPFPPMSRLGMPQARTRQRPCCHLPSYHRTLGRSLKRRGGRGRKEGVGDNHGFAWEGTIFSFIPYESFVRVCFKELNI